MIKFQENQWYIFATTNNLTFISDKKPQIAGYYRDCFVEIQGFKQDKQLYTRVILSTKNHNSEFTTNEVISAENVCNLLKPDDVVHNRLKGKIRIKEEGQQLFYQQLGLEGDIKYLQFLLELLRNMMDNCHSIIAMGGEVIPILQEIALDREFQDDAIQLLFGIGQETTNRLNYRASRIFCSQCLTQFGARSVPLLKWKLIPYYGCRICGQSRSFFEGRIVAVLDKKMKTERIQQNGMLYVNWLRLRTPFDFNEIEIIDADDEDVERFVVQIGNDTDVVRETWYAETLCTVSSRCNLSENTRKILERTFERIKEIE